MPATRALLNVFHRASSVYLPLLNPLLIALLTTVLIACDGSQPQPGISIENNTPSSNNPQGRGAPDSPTSVLVERIDWGQNNSQFGDLYRPVNKPEPLKTVILIHGGCWLSAYGLDYTHPLAVALAEQGFAVWNIEYRRLGNGGEWPALFLDVATAADYLQYLADDYNLDLQQVASVGHSAGGHLALWLASRTLIPSESSLHRAAPLSLKGVITLGGISDLNNPGACGLSSYDIIDSTQISQTDFRARLQETSPIEMLPTHTPTVLLSGEADNIIPEELSADYQAAAVLAGDNSQHIILPNLNHFDLIDPEVMDMTLLLEKLNAFW